MLAGLAVPLALIGALAAPAAAKAAAPTAGLTTAEVVRKVAAANSTLDSWACRFSQNHHFVYLNQTETRQGRLRIKRGKGLRLDLVSEESTEVFTVGHGQAVQWQPKTKQFHIYHVAAESKRDLSPIPFSFGGGFDPGRDHDLKLLESDGTQIGLEMRPKLAEGSTYARKVLWIDLKTWLPARLELTEASTDDVILFAFREVEINPKLEDQLFDLKPPPGADVVDHTDLPSF